MNRRESEMNQRDFLIKHRSHVSDFLSWHRSRVSDFLN